MDTAYMIAGAVSGFIVSVFYLIMAIKYARVGNGYTKGFVLLLLSGLVVLYAAVLYAAVVLGWIDIQQYPHMIRPDSMFIVSLPALTIVWLLDESARR